jgi:hypothetical protein
LTDPQELLHYFEQQLGEVSHERLRLEERESALRQTVEGLRRIAQLNGSPKPTKPDAPEIAPDAFVGLSIKHAAVAYLRLVGIPQTNRQIVDALPRGGITSQAANFAKTVRAVLLHDLDSENGLLTWDAPLWGLREWALPLEGN